MAKERNFELALRAAGLSKLPEEEIVVDKSFKGLAVVKVMKHGGRISWAIGKFDDKLKKVVVSEDFDSKIIVYGKYE